MTEITGRDIILMIIVFYLLPTLGMLWVNREKDLCSKTVGFNTFFPVVNLSYLIIWLIAEMIDMIKDICYKRY